MCHLIVSPYCVFLQIVTAGSGPNIMHWSINGEALASVPSDLGHVFSLVYNTNSKKNEVTPNQDA